MAVSSLRPKSISIMPCALEMFHWGAKGEVLLLCMYDATNKNKLTADQGLAPLTSGHHR